MLLRRKAMPKGIGTYGSKRGRPPKKKTMSKPKSSKKKDEVKDGK